MQPLPCKLPLTPPSYQQSKERCETRLTRLLYSAWLERNSDAASGLAGEEQLGSISRLWMEVRIVQTLWQGDHWSWIMSRQIVPSLREQIQQNVEDASQESSRVLELAASVIIIIIVKVGLLPCSQVSNK